ncbi:MAG: hypothetical protein R3296_08785 [Oleiphilaceae bacterium]|nr:hypothetical protein [Oleiphilaceae bacterium]
MNTISAVATEAERAPRAITSFAEVQSQLNNAKATLELAFKGS